MADKRPPIALILLAGGAAALGAAAATYLVRRRRRKTEAPTAAKADKENEPGAPVAACPKCGAETGEYEFFCLACGQSLDKYSGKE